MRLLIRVGGCRCGLVMEFNGLLSFSCMGRYFSAWSISIVVVVMAVLKAICMGVVHVPTMWYMLILVHSPVGNTPPDQSPK